MSEQTIIVDLDGTLALNSHRNHFIDKSMEKLIGFLTLKLVIKTYLTSQ